MPQACESSDTMFQKLSWYGVEQLCPVGYFASQVVPDAYIQPQSQFGSVFAPCAVYSFSSCAYVNSSCGIAYARGIVSQTGFCPSNCDVHLHLVLSFLCSSGCRRRWATTADAAHTARWFQAGTTEELLSPFPALVDNILRVPGKPDSFWVGFAARPSGLLASPACQSKVLRALISYLPDHVRNMAVGKVGGGVQFNGKDGSVERVIADPTGKHVSSTPAGVALYTSSRLNVYMSSLENDYITHTVL